MGYDVNIFIDSIERIHLLKWLPVFAYMSHSSLETYLQKNMWVWKLYDYDIYNIYDLTCGYISLRSYIYIYL